MPLTKRESTSCVSLEPSSLPSSGKNKAIENYICSDIVSRITSKAGHQSVNILYEDLTSIPYLHNLFVIPGHGWIFNAFKSNKFVYFLPVCWNVICCILCPLLHPPIQIPPRTRRRTLPISSPPTATMSLSSVAHCSTQDRHNTVVTCREGLLLNHRLIPKPSKM